MRARSPQRAKQAALTSAPARASNAGGVKSIFLDKGLHAALLYAFLSLGMTLINKHLVKDLSFTYEATLISLQMLLSVLLLIVLSWLRVISRLSVPRSIYSIAMASTFFFYVLFGLSSLRLMSGMPIWTACRRLSALFVMACDMAFRGQFARFGPVRILRPVPRPRRQAEKVLQFRQRHYFVHKFSVVSPFIRARCPLFW
jgi:hypothetical protein